LPDSRSLYDRLGRDYTLLRVAEAADPAPLMRAAQATGVPVKFVDVAGQVRAETYDSPLVLVRPDQHVAWRGDAIPATSDQLFAVVRGGE
jgi:hypothetical protein